MRGRLCGQESVPSAALAIISHSSPRASIRSRYKVLDLSRADTASYSFFFSKSLARVAADEFEWDPACETRLGAREWRIIPIYDVTYNVREW